MVQVTGLPGIEVHVVVGERALSEHLDPAVADTKTSATRYLEIEEGKKFEIRFTSKGGLGSLGRSLQFNTSVDGHPVARHVSRTSSTQMSCCGKRISPTLLKPFAFEELQQVKKMSDSEEELRKELGLIEIRIDIVGRTGTMSRSGFYNELTLTPTVSKKHASQQALSNFVGYASPISSKAGNATSAKTIEKGVAHFKFIYRSKADLQALHILPADVKDMALNEKPPAALTLDEIAQLQAEHRNMGDKEIQNLKRKRSRSPQARKPFNAGSVDASQVIALSSDEEDDW